ncbi:MAG: hypothetical protein BWY82_03013 [Verrucomicrobia bacterium ADurb.Bin474]|nr:MAG: hypothetical protein BWY82_03013 [Verrucomicrobia bacterium ADurb.Bin474]
MVAIYPTGVDHHQPGAQAICQVNRALKRIYTDAPFFFHQGGYLEIAHLELFVWDHSRAGIVDRPDVVSIEVESFEFFGSDLVIKLKPRKA